MCGANVNPTPAISVAAVFNGINIILFCIAAGAPWYSECVDGKGRGATSTWAQTHDDRLPPPSSPLRVSACGTQFSSTRPPPPAPTLFAAWKANTGDGYLEVSLFGFNSKNAVSKAGAGGSTWSGPVSYKDYYDNWNSNICSDTTLATCVTWQAAYKLITGLAAGGGALFILGVFLSILAFVFTAIAAYHKNKKTDPTPGTCAAQSSNCAASVVPEVFMFIFALTGVIIGALGCVASFIFLAAGASSYFTTNGVVSNGAGVACGAIVVITTFIVRSTSARSVSASPASFPSV